MRESWCYRLALYHKDRDHLHANGSEGFEAYFKKPGKPKAGWQMKCYSRLKNCLPKEENDGEGNVLKEHYCN